jgi:hypothetical protein
MLTMTGLALVAVLPGHASVGRAADVPAGFTAGRPDIRSMSTLAFGPGGILCVGDSKGGAVFLIDTGDRTSAEAPDTFGVKDLEAKIAAVLGTTAEDVMIHDMAVNPISHSTFFPVSRARRQWQDRWSLPNDLADADLILRVTVDEKFEVLKLDAGAHIKGHTLAEFGSGNYPMDMVRISWKGKDVFVMSNSQLPLMTFTPESIREELKKPGITRESPTYTEGVPYTARAGSSVQHLDNFSDKSVAGLQRMPSGRLDLVLYSIERMAL